MAEGMQARFGRGAALFMADCGGLRDAGKGYRVFALSSGHSGIDQGSAGKASMSPPWLDPCPFGLWMSGVRAAPRHNVLFGLTHGTRRLPEGNSTGILVN